MSELEGRAKFTEKRVSGWDYVRTASAADLLSLALGIDKLRPEPVVRSVKADETDKVKIEALRSLILKKMMRDSGIQNNIIKSIMIKVVKGS